jgi:hypothetical protein
MENFNLSRNGKMKCGWHTAAFTFHPNFPAVEHHTTDEKLKTGLQRWLKTSQF